jgi:uncharacterized Zn-binding protein involved in type VI secretion
MDAHLVIVSSGPPVTQVLPFSGRLVDGLSSNVRIQQRPAAVVGSTAVNTPPHVPVAPGAAFSRPPSNQGTVQSGSATVRINGKPAARAGDTVMTCNDPSPAPTSSIVAVSTVMIGG